MRKLDTLKARQWVELVTRNGVTVPPNTKTAQGQFYQATKLAPPDENNTTNKAWGGTAETSLTADVVVEPEKPVPQSQPHLQSHISAECVSETALSETAPVDAKLDEYRHAMRQQLIEIEKLREEVRRLTAEADAHQTLRSIYTNPASSEMNRIKAAAAALPIEKPKLMPERAPLELQAADVVPLRLLVEQRRARSDAFWDQMNGNGSDDPSDASER